MPSILPRPPLALDVILEGRHGHVCGATDVHGFEVAGADELVCSTAWSAGQLIVWVTGEADLSWVFLAGDKAGCTEDYEITSEIGLIGALDDLTDHLMRRRP